MDFLETLKSKTLKSAIIKRFNKLSLDDQSAVGEDTLYDEINHKEIASLWYHLSQDDKSILSDELYNIMEKNS